MPSKKGITANLCQHILKHLFRKQRSCWGSSFQDCGKPAQWWLQPARWMAYRSRNHRRWSRDKYSVRVCFWAISCLTSSILPVLDWSFSSAGLDEFQLSRFPVKITCDTAQTQDVFPMANLDICRISLPCIRIVWRCHRGWLIEPYPICWSYITFNLKNGGNILLRFAVQLHRMWYVPSGEGHEKALFLYLSGLIGLTDMKWIYVWSRSFTLDDAVNLRSIFWQNVR